MTEIWKDIKGYEGVYQVSDKGRVKSLDRYVDHGRHGKVFRKSTIRKTSLSKHGYVRLSLDFNGSKKSYLLHRLIAEAFIPNPDAKPCVNHIDGCKDNNRIDNLEWNTYSENLHHAIDNNLIIPLSGEESPLSQIILQYDLKGNFICEFHSATHASKTTKISRSRICTAAREFKRAGDFIWIYKKDLILFDMSNIKERIKRNVKILEKSPHSKKRIIQLDLQGFVIKEYESSSLAGKDNNIDHSTISKVALGKRKSAGGYKWQYAS